MDTLSLLINSSILGFSLYVQLVDMIKKREVRCIIIVTYEAVGQSNEAMTATLKNDK